MPGPHARAAVAGVVAVVATVCGLAAAPSQAVSGAQSAGAAQTWLERVNEVRVAGGAAAVTENPSWTLGIQHHLTYLEQTPASYRTGQYASAHTENPASPWYTDDGAHEAGNSDLFTGSVDSDVAAIDVWLAAPFHAVGILRPGLRQAAFARDSGGGGLDVISGYSATTQTSPVLFPGAGASTYLTSYNGNERPDPIETCTSTKPGADYSSPGLPIVALLPTAPANGLVATLTTPDGTVLSSKNADVCVVDAATYVSSDTVYGSTGLQILTNDRAVVVVPRVPLVAGSYAVRLAQSKKADVAWSFTVDPATAPTTAPTSTAPTSTAPTSTAPTSTAPTSTAPTTTATSTAPTTAPTTTPTTADPTTPPTSAPTSAPSSTPTPLPAPVAPRPPTVAVSNVTCSWTAVPSGSATVAVTNPAEGAGPASYAVTADGRSFPGGSAADGGTATARLDQLAAGTTTASVSGSDGTTATAPLTVPGCPAYQGARVRFGATRDHAQRVLLDNRRNAGRTRFRIEVGSHATALVVTGGRTDSLRVRLSRTAATRVRVFIGTHLVARERLQP